ncbi:MAG: PTS system fructose subfamily IIA component [Proteobacteria bacterium]|nr:MAG: PTS system fructose subfamily IIA component [Pseudomonadota bacterium]
MIGIVLIGHARIASEMKLAVEHVLGEQPLMAAMDVLESSEPGVLQEKIARLVKQCDAGYGTLIFADMFGGTPCNIALTCLKAGECEVISGFNLPALIKATSDRMKCQKEHVSLSMLAHNVVASGQQYMCLASNFMSANPDHCSPAAGDQVHG